MGITDGGFIDMKVITLLTAGHIGGIETRCKDYALRSEHDNLMLILWGDGYVDEQMRALGIRVINLQASKRNVFATVHRVMEIVREEHADALIAMHAAPMSHLCLMWAKKHIPGVHTIAYATSNAVDMIHIHQKERLWLRKSVIKASLKRADDVVAISKSVKKSLIDVLDTPANRIRTIYNGTDLGRFPYRTRTYEGDRLELIYVGRLIEEKGVQMVIKAIAVLDENVNVRYRIVGDGPYRAELERIAAECDKHGRIEFLGSRDDVPELLQTADVFIHMPFWEEGFGIAVVEAMSAGLICVCALSGAMPEIITDQTDGYLLEKGNEEALRDTLIKISAMSAEDKIRISEAAHRRAEDFSINRYVHNLDDLVSGRWNEDV